MCSENNLPHIAHPLGAFSSQPTRSGHLQCTVIPLSLSLLPPPPTSLAFVPWWHRVFPAFLKFKNAKIRTDRFWCTFSFLKIVTRPLFENVLRNKNVPPTIFRMPASGTPIGHRPGPYGVHVSHEPPRDGRVCSHAEGGGGGDPAPAWLVCMCAACNCRSLYSSEESLPDGSKGYNGSNSHPKTGLSWPMAYP